ncbi:MAG: hypothetical protein RLZZ297_1829 [Chloroflexota bacterium]|jgi:predicted RNA-binding protein
MRIRRVLKFGILGTLLLVGYAAAARRQATIRRLLFTKPLTEPTPPSTRQARDTAEATASCAELLCRFTALHAEAVTQKHTAQTNLNAIVNTSARIEAAEQAAIDDIVSTYRAWSTYYASMLPDSLAACSPNAAQLAQLQIDIDTKFLHNLAAVRDEDFTTAMAYTVAEISRATEMKPYAQKLRAELTVLRREFPLLEWP